jgi:hypothetical protein
MLPESQAGTTSTFLTPPPWGILERGMDFPWLTPDR